MAENTHSSETRGLFEEFDTFQHLPATRIQRFVNLLVDNLFMEYAVSYISAYLLGIVLTSAAPDFIANLDPDQLEVLLVDYLVAIVNYLLYYTICEKAFKGYTLGKLLTGTRAIRNDGKELTFKDALLRSLSRLVPLEQISGFWQPWHDTWTKTMVVKSR